MLRPQLTPSASRGALKAAVQLSLSTRKQGSEATAAGSVSRPSRETQEQSEWFARAFPHVMKGKLTTISGPCCQCDQGNLLSELPIQVESHAEPKAFGAWPSLCALATVQAQNPRPRD